MYLFEDINTRRYSFALVRPGKRTLQREFYSRHAANQFMYDRCARLNIKIIETWDDNHDKTYICSDGSSFYIQRA